MPPAYDPRPEGSPGNTEPAKAADRHHFWRPPRRHRSLFERRHPGVDERAHVPDFRSSGQEGGHRLHAHHGQSRHPRRRKEGVPTAEEDTGRLRLRLLHRMPDGILQHPVHLGGEADQLQRHARLRLRREDAELRFHHERYQPGARIQRETEGERPTGTPGHTGLRAGALAVRQPHPPLLVLQRPGDQLRQQRLAHSRRLPRHRPSRRPARDHGLPPDDGRRRRLLRRSPDAGEDHLRRRVAGLRRHRNLFPERPRHGQSAALHRLPPQRHVVEKDGQRTERSQGARRTLGQAQIGFPRQYQPRDTHAPQRHHRLLEPPHQYGQEGGDSRISADHRDEQRPAAPADKRYTRPVEDRSRVHRPATERVRPLGLLRRTLRLRPPGDGQSVRGAGLRQPLRILPGADGRQPPGAGGAELRHERHQMHLSGRDTHGLPASGRGHLLLRLRYGHRHSGQG